MRLLLLALLAALAGYALAQAGGRRPEAPPPAQATPAPAAVPLAAKPSHDPEALRSALVGSDALLIAPKAVAALEAMTAADFQALVARPKTLPVPSLSDQRFRSAFLAALVERWLAVDPAGALAGVRKVEAGLVFPGGRMDGAGELLGALARVRPEVLLADLPLKAHWGAFEETIPAAFTALAARDPAAARGYLARIDPDQRKAAESAIALGVAGRDPLAGLALAQSLGDENVFHTALATAERGGEALLHELLSANAGRFLPSAEMPELILRHPGEDWSAFEGRVVVTGVSPAMQAEVERLTPAERAERLAGLAQLPKGVQQSIGDALVYQWALDDPRAAMDWTLARAQPGAPEGVASQHARVAWAQWLRSDQAAALAWCKGQPASPLQEALENTAAASLAIAGRLDEAEALFHPLGAGAQEIGNIVANRAEQDPAAAAAWLDRLPAATNKAEATRIVLQKWVGSDAPAAAAWVEAQPAGPPRDSALQAYTRAAADRDPEAAAEWCATIADPAARAKSAELVYYTLRQSDPAGARAWLSALPGTDPAWRERFLRLAR